MSRGTRRRSIYAGLALSCVALLIAAAGIQAQAAPGSSGRKSGPSRTVTKTVTATATVTVTVTATVTETPPPASPTPPAAPPAAEPETTAAAPVETTTPAASAGASSYAWHTNVVATTFWVGEIFDATAADGSQVCSTYDGQWAYHWSGINLGVVPSSADGCGGSIYGGCDGVASGSGSGFQCDTERRTAANGYFPTRATPQENPFYLDLPYDDLNDSTGFAQRCQVIPWAAGSPDCGNPNVSFMKNAWVQIVGPNGATCYGQIQDAGPSSGSAYHDAAYVFGADDPRPLNRKFSGDRSQGAGMDVSPALNGCLGFADLDGDSDHVSWRFVDAADVPAGPWRTIVTTSGVSW